MDEARNTDALLQLIADDAVYMPPGIAPLQGRKAIEELAKAHPWEHLSETPAEIDGRGDLAFVRGAWSITMNGKPVAGYYMEVWQKRPDGAWQVIRKVWNTN
jgi:ketosteroid isomerase-like protein